MGDKPVNYVSWYDSIRFANWLNNGQGTGDTETGAYTLLGGTPTPSNGVSITRNAGATWFLPSEDEWYKAAYHQPAAQGGDSGRLLALSHGQQQPPHGRHGRTAWATSAILGRTSLTTIKEPTGTARMATSRPSAAPAR